MARFFSSGYPLALFGAISYSLRDFGASVGYYPGSGALDLAVSSWRAFYFRSRFYLLISAI
jgi:hypothetical protein